MDTCSAMRVGKRPNQVYKENDQQIARDCLACGWSTASALPPGLW